MDQPTSGPGAGASLPPPAPPGANPPPVMPPVLPPVAPPVVARPPVAPPPVAPPPVAPPAVPSVPYAPAQATIPPEPVPPAGRDRGDGEGHRGVALLLGLVAILAALVGARSTSLANDATDAWQSALRTEVKRSTGALEDIRYVYQAEVPVALVVMGGRLKADELTRAAAGAQGDVAATLAMEAAIEKGVVTSIEGTSPLVTDPAYALPGGGVDLGQRLADQRAEIPDLAALDPDALAVAGDLLAAKGSSMTIALLPLGFAALFGAMAQPFWRRRRLLLGAATGAMGFGLAIALLIEAIG